MKEQRIKIGFSDAESYQHQMESNLKLEILGHGVQEFKNQFNSDIDDLEQFEKDFCLYALNFAKLKHKSGLVLQLQDDQFINLYGLNFEKLQTIQAKYNTQKGSIKCWNNVFSVDDSLDFSVYADTEKEIQKHHDVMELIKAVTNIYERYFIGQRHIQQMQFMNRLYVMNPEGTHLQPNKYFIKNE